MKEITNKVIEEFGDHVLGYVIISAFVRGRSEDIDVVIVVDKKEMIGKVKELEEKLKTKVCDLHLTTLKTFESRLFL